MIEHRVVTIAGFSNHLILCTYIDTDSLLLAIEPIFPIRTLKVADHMHVIKQT